MEALQTRPAAPVTAFQRTAVADTELSGVRIHEGQRLVLFCRSANFDDAVFDDPFRLDILRNPNPHLAFGGTGARYRVGANLARMTVDLVFNAIADNLPDLTALNAPRAPALVVHQGGQTLAGRLRDDLTDDLLSDLIRVEDDGDRLSHTELLMLVGGLLLAGTDTTRNQVAASIDILCDHPEQWELLSERPDLAMAAVDETMRHCPVVGSTLRQASQDFEFGGVLFPKDTFAIVNTAVANRDPSICEDPDRFDITRSALPPILSFGAGVHYCLGANLARLELAEALMSVTRRMRNPRRTGPAPWKPMVSMSGPSTLPVAFDRRP